MSIVEQAPVEVLTETEQRADEVATEAELRARTLEAAALEIEVRGWGQVKLCDRAGRVCMAGAVAAAGGILPDDPIAYEFFYVTWYGREPVEGYKGMVDTLRLPAWNDQTGRTAEEVTARLRSRAAELRSI